MMGKTNLRASRSARGWSFTAQAAAGQGDLSPADKEMCLAARTVLLQLVVSRCGTRRDMKCVPGLSGCQGSGWKKINGAEYKLHPSVKALVHQDMFVRT